MNRITDLKPATYEDLSKVPDGMIAEIISGTLYTQPRPASPHVLASKRLTTRLDSAFDLGETGPGGWTILPEPEVHFSATDIYAPDLAGWRADTMPEFENVAHFKTVPDWVCEVLSPRTKTYDLTDKRDTYARHGVGHIWYIDPDAQTLEAFELRQGEWVLIGALRSVEQVKLAPFAALEFSLGDLWGKK